MNRVICTLTAMLRAGTVHNVEPNEDELFVYNENNECILRVPPYDGCWHCEARGISEDQKAAIEKASGITLIKNDNGYVWSGLENEGRNCSGGINRLTDICLAILNVSQDA